MYAFAVCGSRPWRAPFVVAIALTVSMAALVPWRAATAQRTPDPPPLWGRVELVHQLTIGDSPEGPDYEFGRIAYAVATRGGTAFVVDIADTRILKYDEQGRFRGAIGRVGSGPGEYRQVLGIALHGDSLLLVFDPANGRIAVFDTSGTFRRTVRVVGGGLYGPKVFNVDAEGTIAIRTMAREGHLEGGTFLSLYVRHRLSGDVVDSIPVPAEGSVGFVLMTSDGPRYAFPTTTPYTLLPRGGLATALSSMYRVELVPTRGPRSVVQRSARPIEIGGREREEWEAYAQYFARRSRDPMPRAAAIPRRKPVIRDLYADREGRLWVNVYTEATRREIPPRPPGTSARC